MAQKMEPNSKGGGQIILPSPKRRLKKYRVNDRRAEHHYSYQIPAFSIYTADGEDFMAFGVRSAIMIERKDAS